VWVLGPEGSKQLAADLIGQVLSSVKREMTQNTDRLAELFDVGLAALTQLQVSLDRDAPLLVEGTLEIAGYLFDQVDAVDLPAAFATHAISLA
jgi:hypothetical protein